MIENPYAGPLILALCVVAVVVVAMLAPRHCDQSQRIAVGDAMLLAGCR